MYILIHQIKVLNYDTNQKNIVTSVSFLGTFFPIAEIPPQTCAEQLLPTTSIRNAWLTICLSFTETLIQGKIGEMFSTSWVVHSTSQNLAVFEHSQIW